MKDPLGARGRDRGGAARAPGDFTPIRGEDAHPRLNRAQTRLKVFGISVVPRDVVSKARNKLVITVFKYVGIYCPSA